MIASALLAVAPASATTAITNGTVVTFNIALDSGSVNSGSSYGNTRTFDSAETYKDKNGTKYDVGVVASAWTATKVGTAQTTSSTSYTVSDSYLGQWAGGGLGVINQLEGNGENNSHQTDNNINGTDFILLEFDRPVKLSSISTLAYPMKETNSSNSTTLKVDNDVGIATKMPVTSKTSVTTTETKKEQIKNGTLKQTDKTTAVGPTVTTSRSTTTTADLKAEEAKAGTSTSSTGSPPSSTANGCANYTNCVTKTTTTTTTKVTTNAPTVVAGDFLAKSQTNTNNTNGTVNGKVILAATEVPASRTWLVGASFTNSDGKPDGFKLKSIQVSWKAVVPEPSTWAMMIVGFGFIGCAARRQRRIAATA